MNIDTLNKAIRAADRFLKAVEYAEGDVENGSTSKHTGALRRASMDLTRALANMRKSN